MENVLRRQAVLFAGAGAPAPPSPCSIATTSMRARSRSQDTRSLLVWFSPEANLRARHISSGFQGLKFEVQSGNERFNVESPLIGKSTCITFWRHAAWASLMACSRKTSHAVSQICEAVPGRFERVDEGQPFVVVVDYAHTDDALRNVIAVARGLNPKRVITLFGCGGDRDRSKRPLMGQAAAEGSDFVVLTSDNPRSEDPLAIMNDALVGIRRNGRSPRGGTGPRRRHRPCPERGARRRHRHSGGQGSRDLPGV